MADKAKAAGHGMTTFAAMPGLTEAQVKWAEEVDAGYQERITRQSETITRMVEFMESRPGLLTEFTRWQDGAV